MSITEDHTTFECELNDRISELSPENILWMHVVERFLKDLAGIWKVEWKLEQHRALIEFDDHPELFHEIVFERTGLSQGAAEWVWDQIEVAVKEARKKERNDPLSLKHKTKKLFTVRKDRC